jgi:hypothetical protein
MCLKGNCYILQEVKLHFSYIIYCLCHLRVRKTQRKQSLVGYSQSHFVTFDEDLQILSKKTMDI